MINKINEVLTFIIPILILLIEIKMHLIRHLFSKSIKSFDINLTKIIKEDL